MPRLSLCMIVRDEETMLPDCLRSVRGVVDEIVVLDTGSTDATAAIARRAGARVLRHPWRDDFAAARNAALAAATGEWILVLDADERLGPGAKQALHAAMRSGIDCGMLPLHDATRLDATFPEVVSGRARKGAPTLLPRLLRRTPDLAWVGVVHESVGAWLTAAARRVGKVDADIVHYGAIPDVRAARAKDARNLRLLERRCELEPESAPAWGYLAREWLRSGEPARARDACREGVRAARAAWGAGQRPAVVQLLSLHVTLLLEDELPEASLALLGEAEAQGARHPNLDLLAGIAHERVGDALAAESAFRRALARAGEAHTEDVIDGATGWAAQAGVGRLHARAGQHAEAVAAFDAALAREGAPQDVRLHRIASLAVLRPREALAALAPELVEGARTEVWVVAALVCDALGAGPDARLFLDRAKGPVLRGWRERLAALRARDRGRMLFEALGVPTVQGPDAASLLATAEGHAEEGDATGALGCALAALRHDARATGAWVLVGEVLRALEERETACAILGGARELLPEDAQLLAVLALLHREDGRPAEAAYFARRALRLAPEDALAHEVLEGTGVHGEGGTVHPDTAIAHRLEGARDPLLSVIVATHRRPGGLLDLLDRIALSDLDRRAFEVIVVDDGSPEPIHDTGPRPFTLSILRQEHAGPAAAHNHALRQARGEWVLIYEDDALPDPGGLRAHLSAQLAEPGPTALLGADDGADPSFVLNQDLRLGVTNLSLPRAALQTAGGFDPIGDGELRYRIERHGVTVRRVPEIACGRDSKPSWETRLERCEGEGREAWRAWAKHGDPRLVPLLDGDPDDDAPWSRLRAWLEGARDLEDRLTVQLAAVHRAGMPASEEEQARIREATRTLRDLRYQHGLLKAREGFPHGWRPSRHPRRATTSVILPNLNGFPHVEGCLATLRAHTPEPLEVIVVDNGSTDGSLEWLRRQPGVHLLEMGENVGAPAARNRGLAVASGERVLFCDNDVLFTPRWLEIMVGHLEAWPDIGMVGPMSDYVVAPQKIEEAPPGKADLDAWATAFHARNRGRHAYTNQLILFFILFRREMVEQVGGIDEAYGRWGFEDNDWALRARIAGWKLRLAQDVFIRHLGSQTARSANLDYGRLLLENWEVFKRKWGLDPALPYGSPFDVDALARQPFDPARHHVGFRGRPSA